MIFVPSLSSAPPPGFEPGPSEPKSEVLPLHYGGRAGPNPRAHGDTGGPRRSAQPSLCSIHDRTSTLSRDTQDTPISTRRVVTAAGQIIYGSVGYAMAVTYGHAIGVSMVAPPLSRVVAAPRMLRGARR